MTSCPWIPQYSPVSSIFFATRLSSAKRSQTSSELTQNKYSYSKTKAFGHGVNPDIERTKDPKALCVSSFTSPAEDLPVPFQSALKLAAVPTGLDPMRT